PVFRVVSLPQAGRGGLSGRPSAVLRAGGRYSGYHLPAVAQYRIAGTRPTLRHAPATPLIKETATMESTIIEHYRAYKPRAFTRADREETTILFGGLHWRAERLIQGALANLGYRTRVLPTATRDDLLTGREVADIGQCCPTSFTTGNLANFLRAEARAGSSADVARKYAYVTAGACGACRFGQYHQSYELALRNVGMESFRMFLLAQNGLDQGAAEGGGLELNLPFTLGAIWALIVGDVIQDLEYQVRPYEVKAGETERVVRESVEHLFEVFR